MRNWFSIIFVLIFVIPCLVSAEPVTLCVGNLSGYSAYKAENHEFLPDKLSNPIIIQISERGVSVMGWSPFSCNATGEQTIVCHSGGTIETFAISDNGRVYYTKSVVNAVVDHTKAMVGSVVDC